MLRLIFHFNGEILKARLPQPGEELTNPIRWHDNVEFELTDKMIFMMAWTSLIPDLPAKDAKCLVEIASARYPVSPHYEELHRLAPDLVVGYDDPEWVFFGGTFHPWHAGHQACLKLLPDEKTCFVLPDRNPLKDFRELDPVTTVIELSSKIKFKNKHFLVPTFLLDSKKNPTVEWVERVKKEFPNKKLSLLIGFDSLLTIHTWNRPQDLLTKLEHLYVVSRMEEDSEREKAAEFSRNAAPGLEIVFLGHHEFEGLSSTEMRKKK